MRKILFTVPYIDCSNEINLASLKNIRTTYSKKIAGVDFEVLYFETSPMEKLEYTEKSGFIIGMGDKYYCIDEINGFLWNLHVGEFQIENAELCNFNYPNDNVHPETRCGIITDFIANEIETKDAFLECLGSNLCKLTDEQIFKNFEKLSVMFNKEMKFDYYWFEPSKYICNMNSGTLLERFLYNELTKEEREVFEEQLVYPKRYENNEDFIKSDNIFKFSFVHTNNEKIVAFLKEFNQRIWDDSFQEDFVCDTKWLFVYYMCCKSFSIESSLLLKFKIDYLMLPNWVNDSEIFISIQDIQNYFNMIFEILQEDNGLLRYKKMYALISNFEREYKFIKKYHMEERCGVSEVEDECK